MRGFADEVKKGYRFDHGDVFTFGGKGVSVSKLDGDGGKFPINIQIGTEGASLSMEGAINLMAAIQSLLLGGELPHCDSSKFNVEVEKEDNYGKTIL